MRGSIRHLARRCPVVKQPQTLRPMFWSAICGWPGRGAAAKLLNWVRVVVTEIAWDGSLRRRALDTSGLTDPGRWDELIEQVLTVPPPYRATPSHPVYVIHAADRAAL